MIKRNITPAVLKALKQFPVITITGPRQSGKTTLAQNLPGDFEYVNLERPDLREFAEEDSLGFLREYGRKKLIIDEVQYVPKLFSYIQAESDKRNKNGQFILTGSQNFLLLQKISQSLAGRSAIFELLPFSISELLNAGQLPSSYEQMILKGGYPRLYQSKSDKHLLISSYIRTYVERDVRQIVNVQSLSLFSKFLKACAARSGQLLNFSSMGNELGIDHKTIMNWMSVLQASYIVYLLQPHHNNFNKRLVKTPKLYFYDTGMATSLLGIENISQLQHHPLKGELFENLIFTELIKKSLNKGKSPALFFWRDSTGNEVDFLEEAGREMLAYEVKSSRTINANLLNGLLKYKDLGGDNVNLNLIYGGSENQKRTNVNILNWKSLM